MLSSHHTPAAQRGLESGDELTRMVRAAAAGEERAWNALVLRFTPTIHRIARAHGLQAADADDVTEATWLRLVESIDRLRAPSTIVGWLTVTAQRESLRLLRERRGASDAEIAALAETMEDPDHFEERVEQDEAREVVNRALAALPDRQRALIRKLMIEDRSSYDEVAAELQIPIGSIGPTRARALERLRRDPEVAKALEALL